MKEPLISHRDYVYVKLYEYCKLFFEYDSESWQISMVISKKMDDILFSICGIIKKEIDDI